MRRYVAIDHLPSHPGPVRRFPALVTEPLITFCCDPDFSGHFARNPPKARGNRNLCVGFFSQVVNML
jgi:hypothetical protein